MADVGGGSGRICAGFKEVHPEWDCKVVELSSEAVSAGEKRFPDLKFFIASLTEENGLPCGICDVLVVSGVMCWIDRSLLARAISNLDSCIADGGFLVLSEFDCTGLRANEYTYQKGLYTYKQDYSSIFTALGTYHEIYRHSELITAHTSADENDPYDKTWATVLLRKDLFKRYMRK